LSEEEEIVPLPSYLIAIYCFVAMGGILMMGLLAS